MRIDIAIEWQRPPQQGQINVFQGHLLGGHFVRGRGELQAGKFRCLPEDENSRLTLTIEAEGLEAGAHPTIVSVQCGDRSFSFFLRDVNREFPILIPEYAVAVTHTDDSRDYQAILKNFLDKGLLSKLQTIATNPEASFEQAAAQCRRLIHPIWLGVSRDVRIFETGLREPMAYCDWIQPRWHGHGYFWPEKDYTSERYGFVAGRGWGCTEQTERHLDEGVLPIFHATRVDDDIRYEQVSFVTLEQSALCAAGIRGTHALVADGLSVMHSFTPDQQKAYESWKEKELNQPEETVFCCRIEAINTASVPRYVFFKNVHPLARFGNPGTQNYDGKTGFGRLPDSELIFGISRLNGQPMPQEEIAILVRPGEKATYEFYLPHQPIPTSRAVLLAQRGMDRLLGECRAFWREKLTQAAQIRLPEKRIEQMLQAGLLHLDLVTYGHEPEGALNATNGTYSALGSETVRNIQVYDSVGWHEKARRCLEFFLDKQHEDGLMQNFGGYMLETGAILWCLGEHYRYTRDEQWVEHIRPKVHRACDYLLQWRQKNLRDDLRGRGYGMLDGKVADPEDPERTFMLNGYAYLGLSRAAQMLSGCEGLYAEKLVREAEAFRADIRQAFFDSLAQGPVVPSGDGSWVPTVSPWVGPVGPVCLFIDGKNWWTHGAMTLRDDILGALHLAYQEVLDANELAVSLLLKSQTELLTSKNVSLSQPFYSSQPFLHLRRGETKAFLMSYYHMIAALADREIYSFWEHFYHESPHKTAEEAQFLLLTRMMLYIEEGSQLRLLQGIPRMWLRDGMQIILNNVASYFGPFSLAVDSHLNEGYIQVRITCTDRARQPERVTIRLAHPEERKASGVEGGIYDSQRENIIIEKFPGEANLKLWF